MAEYTDKFKEQLEELNRVLVADLLYAWQTHIEKNELDTPSQLRSGFKDNAAEFITALFQDPDFTNGIEALVEEWADTTDFDA